MESFKPIKMKEKDNWDDSDASEAENEEEEEIIEAGPVDEAVDSDDEDW